MARVRVGWLPLAGAAGALVVVGVALGGDAGAQSGDPLIDAEIAATVVVSGGDAEGGDAVGGDAGLTVSLADGSGTIAQQAERLEGGSAFGGDALGGDGLNAEIDATVILDADVDLQVEADVGVTTVAGADLDLSDVNVNDVLAQETVGQAAVAQPVLGPADVVGPRGIRAAELARLGRGLPIDTGSLQSALGENPLGGLLGGLAGLNLLDLVAELNVEVEGGDAIGGSAEAGDALLVASISGEGSGADVFQSAETVVGGDATGGGATGGDGIELDVILDADIELLVDANVDVAATVDTLIEANLNRRNAAQLVLFERVE